MTCKCPLCETYLGTLDARLKCYPQTGLVLWNGGYAQLTFNQAVILDKILKAWPSAATNDELAMHYYLACRHEDDPPSDETVKVQISQLRRALREANAPFEIPPVRIHGSGYRIKFTDQKRNAA